jgi:hypothetical protein
MTVVTSTNDLSYTGAQGAVTLPAIAERTTRMPVVPAAAISSGEPQVCLVQRTDSRRHQVEQFIAAGFAAAYQADIEQFMPQLLTVFARDTLQAVLGVRSGQSEKLFVEQYLDADISFVLRDIGVVTQRAQIVEIGNLYSANRHYISLLFVVTAYALYQAGFRHLVCCATPQVQSMLSRHGLQLKTLAEGDPSRLTGDASTWGTYYESHPMVCHLDLAQAMTLIGGDAKLSQLTEQFWPASQPLLNGQALEN